MQLISSPTIELQLGDWAAFSPAFKAVSVLHLHSLFQLHPNAEILQEARTFYCIWKTMEKLIYGWWPVSPAVRVSN